MIYIYQFIQPFQLYKEYHQQLPGLKKWEN